MTDAAAIECPSEAADVCLLVEGCYPFVPGGVSAWIDWLMRSLPEITFSIVSLWPRPDTAPARYELPPNARGLDRLYLQDYGARPTGRIAVPPEADGLGRALTRFMTQGGMESLASVHDALAKVRRHVPPAQIFNSPVGWQIARQMYEEEMPYGSFLHFFWAWRALLGGVLATLDHPLPPARIYHAISTGYAGVLAARAGLETGRPVLLTEHGLYTNERRIELLMADWVADTVDKGHALTDSRLDLRDMWIRAFEAYARTCYEGADEIVTLYRDNQRMQRVLGAAPERMRVIANGIDVAPYQHLQPPGASEPPTVALIGRVVPIKDVKTFIAAVGLLRAQVPDLRALVLGSLDEEPVYAGECKALAERLGLGRTIVFTGNVDVRAWLGRIHVVALTSISESQPLVLLEAGAAAIPFVATDVGCCREVLDGRADESPRLGAGGIVTNVVAPAEIARAMGQLLRDTDRRRAMGQALRARVERYYRAEHAAAAYRDLYRQHAASADAPRAWR